MEAVTELQLVIIDRAKIKKFQKETSTPRKLRSYFKYMVDKLAQPLLEIDTDFYEYDVVGEFADNYTILDTYIIVNGTDEKNEVVFKLSNISEKEKLLLSVHFENDKAMVDGRHLTEVDLEKVLITAIN